MFRRSSKKKMGGPGTQDEMDGDMRIEDSALIEEASVGTPHTNHITICHKISHKMSK